MGDAKEHPHHPMPFELLGSPLSVYWVPNRIIELSPEGDQLMEEPHAVRIARKVLTDLDAVLNAENAAFYDSGSFAVTNWNTLEAMSRLVENWDRQNAQER